jgi:hypothetical protein
LPTSKNERIVAKCCHCSHVLSRRSSGGIGHLLQHHKVCVAKSTHTALIQSHMQFNVDGSVYTWEYNPDVARKELCCLIVRLDLPFEFVVVKSILQL